MFEEKFKETARPVLLERSFRLEHLEHLANSRSRIEWMQMMKNADQLLSHHNGPQLKLKIPNFLNSFRMHWVSKRLKLHKSSLSLEL